MTRKQSKDTPIMRSNKKGYSLVEHRRFLSLNVISDILIWRLSEELKCDEKEVKEWAIREAKSIVKSWDDEGVEKAINKIIENSENLKIG
ncbi:hypothetical protein H6G54_22155 [Anabaena cylindrica FACHB-243]|uniref:Uncharacterized protein n=1 Tax=Anabaena cylindrica (strain ATCC 27899 / PCC 7122) TaxID=272123 RepID=K9ZEM9_ANACC|nr:MULTISPECIES: hypothetical protein [Anabaena]AFZ57646.1 hypothetical protein Anacy_2181 [Anabaena cylindrica PCC 7122]AZL96676.1 hypothetical protein [Anabaena sp. CCAP 1446/1C]MBD2420356.1 hypothetical protein [Anabaena cylindrica FACHB-243]MBY5285731.1 hypothetical protein [Anabaena sp. CCAP 1446/1C]MBY5310516.1 hypothetical protein [Anabaena sp. CCAP 1446/1C]